MTPSEASQAWLPLLEKWRIEYQYKPLGTIGGHAAFLSTTEPPSNGYLAAIRLQVGIDATHQVYIFIHELAHVFLHGAPYGIEPYTLSPELVELEADMATMKVMQTLQVEGVRYGVDDFNARHGDVFETADVVFHHERVQQAVERIHYLLNGGAAPQPATPIVVSQPESVVYTPPPPKPAATMSWHEATGGHKGCALDLLQGGAIMVIGVPLMFGAIALILWLIAKALGLN